MGAGGTLRTKLASSNIMCQEVCKEVSNPVDSLSCLAAVVAGVSKNRL